MSFFSRVAKAFRFGRQQYFIGKDLDSNLYYEYPSLDGSLDPRKTRRVIKYKIHKELGEHDQAALPIQWLMWLRHTRKSAPSIEELVQDIQRIETTRHNAKILEARDAERRLHLEQRAADETRQARQYLEPSSSTENAQTSRVQSPRATAVPTASVSETGVEQDGHQSRRNVDMEVWEASRKRVEQQNIQQEDATSRRASKRSELNAKDSERERAKRAMSRSPLEDFDVSYEEDEAPQQPREQLQPRFGRPAGPGEEWSPQSWTPTPRR
ncbi:hypothetical protein CBS101457_003219 [Exobasidium rhododendri]|nr:hypothetical protein CBS101457_003219 [Exobasidium rhododendri]